MKEIDKIFEEAIKSKDDCPSCVRPTQNKQKFRDVIAEVEALEKFGYKSVYDQEKNQFLFFDENKKKCAILC